jgi:protease I
MIVPPANFRDEEYFKPKQILENAGHIITTGSTIADEIRSAQGKLVESKVRLTTAETFDYDAVIFVGGPGMIELVANPDMTDLAKKFHSENKLVGAICVAPAILANSGIINGKKATATENAIPTLESSGANYTGEPVETDGNIITANGPAAATKFAEAIASYLKNSNVQPSS